MTIKNSIPENLSDRQEMAPPGIKDTPPLLNQLIKWFLDPGVVADSPVFKLHHQVNISCGNNVFLLFLFRQPHSSLSWDSCSSLSRITWTPRPSSASTSSSPTPNSTAGSTDTPTSLLTSEASLELK